MQEVSKAWIEAQKRNFVPESYVEVTLNVGDPESQADASPESNGEIDISSASRLTDGTERNPTKYAFLERNMWVLNGTMKVIPTDGDTGNQGYIGDVLSDNNGKYSGNIPTITISFSKVFTELIPGVSISWATAYEEYATKYRITAYAGTEQTYQGTFTNNGDMVSVAAADIDRYDKIVIEVLEWCLPRRRARIESILIGIIKKYSKKELMSYEHSNAVDPLSFELPKNEISFKIKNLNGEYNPDNPQGAERYLMERQAVSVRYGYMLGGVVEWIKAGTFYMSEWETPQNGITATLTARDALEYMSDLYEGESSGTLMDIAVSALEQADLPVRTDGTSNWMLDESLTAISAASGADLSESTIAEVLQYVANAACCVFYQDRNGYIHIEPLGDDQTDYLIGRFVSYANSEIELTKQLKAVNINNKQYILTVGKVGETQNVDNPLISDSRAPVVAQWVADYLVNRRILTGDFRADPRLDALDRVINQNQFASSNVLVTEVNFTYNGAFRGSYEGRAGV